MFILCQAPGGSRVAEICSKERGYAYPYPEYVVSCLELGLQLRRDERLGFFNPNLLLPKWRTIIQVSLHEGTGILI